MTSDENQSAENIDLITESLMPGHRDALRRLFSDQGARAPLVVWSPGLQDMQSPLQRRFVETCEQMMDDGGCVPDSAVDLELFEAGLRDWIMVVTPDNGAFRYDYYGKGIADHYGQDMTGKTTAGFGGHIAQFFEALYHAAERRRERVLSEHEPPATVFVKAWRRLIIPLMDTDRETVIRFLVLNLPENELRTGLELMVDPVFVMDRGQVVHYANGAAQRLFGLSSVRAPGPTLRQMTGLTLEALPSPEDMLARRAVEESTQLTLNGGIAERLVTTVSAAEHRGAAFYVVVLRLIGT